MKKILLALALIASALGCQSDRPAANPAANQANATATTRAAATPGRIIQMTPGRDGRTYDLR